MPDATDANHSAPSYTPSPIPTDHINLPSELAPLLEQLAENVHDHWARQRLAQGWTWGPTRDDARKKHPGLAPYDQLDETEKDYDRTTAAETLKAILALGYHIQAP